MDDSADLSEIKADVEVPLEDVERVHYGLGKLSLAHAEALTLFLLEDMSMNEMVQVVDVPLGTVKSRLYHARRALRDVLEKEGE